MTVGDNEYYFRKNIFGDIVGVYDSSRTALVTYTYDAFGNATVKVHPINDKNAQLNPFRYRGYYWDSEFNLYYVQSRYYDPEIGRFISPDSIEYITPSEIFGLNLYAYCINNPIMYYDPTGTSALLLILILLATTIAGGVVGGVTAYNQGERGWGVIKNIILGASIGLAVGGAIIMLGGITVGAISALLGKTVTFLGVSALRSFAIGALAYNFTAFFVAPLYGIDMEGIEYEPNGYKPYIPGIATKHPAEKGRLRTI